MTDRVRQPLTADRFRLNRRDFLATSAAVAGGMAMTPVVGLGHADAAKTLKEVHFSEAVHNLGYINLYVGMHAGIFEKNGLDMKVVAAGGDTQTFAAVLGGAADFSNGGSTHGPMLRGKGGPGLPSRARPQRAPSFRVA